MTVLDLPRADSVRLFTTIRVLPEAARPARIVRAGGRSLLAFDPRHTRREITEWCVDNLTVAEQDAARRAWGLPPAGTDTPTWVVEDQPALLFVPRDLRLAGQPAMQGGWVLAERHRAGDLHDEEQAYLAELRQENAVPQQARSQSSA